MRKRSTGARLNLGEPLASELADFCAAHYGAPEIEVIRVALRAYIQERLQAEPEMKKRYEENRRKRLGLTEEKIRLVHSEENEKK